MPIPALPHLIVAAGTEFPSRLERPSVTGTEYAWLDSAKMKIYYNPKLKQLAQELRKNSTLAEVLLWQRLRNKQFHGLDFHRQKPINEYIVDFFCPKLKLIIEIDGESHDSKQSEDAKRQVRLEDFGLTVIRFLDSDVKTNLDGILRDLENKFNLSSKNDC